MTAREEIRWLAAVGGAVGISISIGIVVFQSITASLLATTVIGVLGAGALGGQLKRARWWHRYDLRVSPSGLHVDPIGPGQREITLRWSDIDRVSPTLRPRCGLVVELADRELFLPAHHTARQLDRLADLLDSLANAEARGRAPAELLALARRPGVEPG